MAIQKIRKIIPTFESNPVFRTDMFTKAIVTNPGANSLRVNSNVLVPDGFLKTREKIEQAGYSTITVDVSEFRKPDGGLSCLPVIYNFSLPESQRWPDQ